MSILVNLKEIENILKQSKDKRYKYFLNKVSDTGLIWGLYNDGWALAADDLGGVMIPLWPMKEYAEICALNEWSGYKPKSIKLKNFIKSHINDLKEDNIFISIFYSAENKGIVVDHESFKSDLENCLSRIE